MLRLEKIMNENNITKKYLSRFLPCSAKTLCDCISLKSDFKYSNLVKIYDLFQSWQIIEDSFDIGSLLDFV